ncbi:unnamed protein product [Polarella glacialis]|uniref:Uncharacterized protein n=1 Tax=Polarella glacialis TaxID=89957 RepID=A0A813LFI0_POLGL|nr:unnamed protein product [Polarella glacialis]
MLATMPPDLPVSVTEVVPVSPLTGRSAIVFRAEHQQLRQLNMPMKLVTLCRQQILRPPLCLVRTDADNLGRLIRSQPLRRHDAPITDVGAEMDDDEPTDSGKAMVKALEKHEEDSSDEEARCVASGQEDAERAAAGADVVETVEKFQLDEDFDYDHCTLSQPEYPYNQRPRP